MKKRLKTALLIPMLLITLSGLAYAIWTDAITIQATLITAQAPTISVEKGFINLGHSLVTINVRKSDKVIISTSPGVVRIFINITNTGVTPINMIIVTDVLPNDWYWHPENAQVQLIQEDETTIEIGEPYFTMSYNSATQTLTVVVHDIMSAIGKHLGTNEKVRIMFNIDYTLKGSLLPSKYETSPPLYSDIATATAWISEWSSQTVTASATFPTEIKWVSS